MAPGEPRRLGLALGAGGARGLAHVGVLRALQEAGFAIHALAGTSIGALVGAIFAVGRLEQFEAELLDLAWLRAVRLIDPVWPRSGLVSGARTEALLTRWLGAWRIEDLPLPFAAVAVDLASGEEVVIREGPLVDAVRASISIPGVFVPRRQGERLLVDGALRNPVPVSVLEGAADVRVAVNLHARTCGDLGASPLRPRRPGLAQVARRLVRRLDPRVPDPQRRNGEEVDAGLFEILTASMTVLESELARHRLAREPVDVVLEPDVHGIRSLEFNKAERAIRAGHDEALRRLPSIERALALARR